MASSKVMPTNPDPPRGQSPPKHYHHLPKSSFGSINMDDIISNIYADPNSFPGDGGGDKTADEVWKEIVAGREPEMTLEDFLSKAGAVGEEVGEPALPGLGFGTGPALPEGVVIQGGTVLVGRGAGGGGRGKRRAAVEEPPMDKATQQKQRRMIKNRESAARSRERKQAYTVELEALVTQLEEENARLVKEEAEESKKRLKQLMENLIPVEDKIKPPRIQTLRRSNSMHW